MDFQTNQGKRKREKYKRKKRVKRKKKKPQEEERKEGNQKHDDKEKSLLDEIEKEKLVSLYGTEIKMHSSTKQTIISKLMLEKRMYQKNAYNACNTIQILQDSNRVLKQQLGRLFQELSNNNANKNTNDPKRIRTFSVRNLSLRVSPKSQTGNTKSMTSLRNSDTDYSELQQVNLNLKIKQKQLRESNNQIQDALQKMLTTQNQQQDLIDKIGITLEQVVLEAHPLVGDGKRKLLPKMLDDSTSYTTEVIYQMSLDLHNQIKEIKLVILRRGYKPPDFNDSDDQKSSKKLQEQKRKIQLLEKKILQMHLTDNDSQRSNRSQSALNYLKEKNSSLERELKEQDKLLQLEQKLKKELQEKCISQERELKYTNIQLEQQNDLSQDIYMVEEQIGNEKTKKLKLQRQLEDKTKECEELSKIAFEKKQQISKLRKATRELEVQVFTLNQQLTKEQLKIRQITQQNEEELRKNSTEFNFFKNECTVVQKELKEKKERIKELKKQLKQMNTVNDGQANELTAETKEHIECQAEIKSYKKEFLSHQQNVEQLEDILIQKSDSIKMLQGDIQECKQENDQLNDDLARQIERNKEKDTQIDSLNELVDQLQANTNTEYQGGYSDDNQLQDLLELAGMKLQQKEKELTSLDKDYTHLQKQSKIYQITIKKLKTDLSSSKKLSTENSNLQQQIKEKDQMIIDFQIETAKLKEKVSKKRQRVKQLLAEKTRYDTNPRSRSYTQVQVNPQQNIQNDKVKRDMKRQIQKLTNTVDYNKFLIKQKDKKVSKKEQKIKDLQKQVSKLKQDKSNYKLKTIQQKQQLKKFQPEEEKYPRYKYTAKYGLQSQMEYIKQQYKRNVKQIKDQTEYRIKEYVAQINNMLKVIKSLQNKR